ncbi:MAG: LTA synthase family protein, partial [Lactobacillus crispatus]|nr:LTA synthase family protein [Lactobacillus crispatus]
MSEINKKKSLNVAQIICIILASFIMLVQMFSWSKAFGRMPLSSLMRYIPGLLGRSTTVLVPMVFGAVYSKKKVHPTEAFRFWIMAIVTLVLLYLAYFFRVPGGFNMWKLWGVFFPVLTSTSVLLAGLIFSMFAQPYLYELQHRITTKQNLILLSALTLLGFATSAGTYNLRYSIYGLYLILYFAWGMFLANVKIPKKAFGWSIGAGIVSFFVMFIGVPGFTAVNWYQRLSGRSSVYAWNPRFLSNVTSPFLFLMVLAAFLIFRKVIVSFSAKEMRFFIPVIIFMDAPVGSGFVKSFRFTNSAILNKVLMTVIMILVAFLLDYLYERYLFKVKPVKNAISFFNKHNNLAEVVEDAWKNFAAWVIENRVRILTWCWFYILSFASFLIESDGLRIQITTSSDINAVVFLLGTRFFAIVLTAIFLDAMFAIFYFITTRYWTSTVLVSVITIGWAIANKIKLNLRGEPIYPTEIDEIVNWKTLLPMVGEKTVIMIAVALVVIIALCVFLEIKFPIKKKGSWKRRGIWALLSLLLFMTP